MLRSEKINKQINNLNHDDSHCDQGTQSTSLSGNMLDQYRRMSNNTIWRIFPQNGGCNPQILQMISAQGERGGGEPLNSAFFKMGIFGSKNTIYSSFSLVLALLVHFFTFWGPFLTLFDAKTPFLVRVTQIPPDLFDTG